jgi:adenine-specific DNA-methyltransferase
MIDRSRRFRKNATDAENALWKLLRARRLSGAKFRRQHPFGRYILDFYSVEARLAIEVDGGQHLSPDGVERDAARTRFLRARRIRVLRFTDREVLLEPDGVIASIERVLAMTPRTSPPSP